MAASAMVTQTEKLEAVISETLMPRSNVGVGVMVKLGRVNAMEELRRPWQRVKISLRGALLEL